MTKTSRSRSSANHGSGSWTRAIAPQDGLHAVRKLSRRFALAAAPVAVLSDAADRSRVRPALAVAVCGEPERNHHKPLLFARPRSRRAVHELPRALGPGRRDGHRPVGHPQRRRRGYHAGKVRRRRERQARQPARDDALVGRVSAALCSPRKSVVNDAVHLPAATERIRPCPSPPLRIPQRGLPRS